MALIIGLTGGIGSGKTAATQWFEQHGITVVDADIIARQIVAIGQPALEEIIALFGTWAALPDGSLNRPALRQHIFSQPQARLQLEGITHPRIREQIIQQLAAASSPYCILVSPLLIESRQHELVSRTLLIDVPEHLQLSRASLRDVQSAQEIAKIIEVQLPRVQRQSFADDIVLNDGDLQHLYQQLAPLHQKYLNLAMAT